jgi:LNS2-like protein (lipin/Ned1/Smp2)
MACRFGDTPGMRRLLPVLALLAACSSDSEPALTRATSLSCPFPGALPFRTASNGFQRPVNKSTAAMEMQSKDEASDTLGNPGGLAASVYIADDQSPSTAAVAYHGTKARTKPISGLLSDGLGGENVSLWYYDPGAMAWQSIGSGKTDDNGGYDVAAGGFVAPPGEPVYSMLEADGSCAVHYDYLFAPGTKVVVFDIDGTLTTDDNEILLQVADETHVPAKMTGAVEVTQAWAQKGYHVIYLTARQHLLRPESRGWLAGLGFAGGPLITEGSGKPADVYKTLWMNRMIQSFQWKVVAAYGNADTDITAYANASVALDHTFIIGPLAGNRGTVAIPNMDYTAHIAGFVAAQAAIP